MVRAMRPWLLALAFLSACSDDKAPYCHVAATESVFVQGRGVTNDDCRTGICRHNENTDLIRWKDAIYLVHRTAESQILGPNSALHVYRSTDEGKSFGEVAVFPAIRDRDIRDPSFYIVGDELFMKAITRIPGFAARDEGVRSVSIALHSPDGASWSYAADLGPEGWGFWRVVQHEGVYYSAAYQDGDLQVVLYRSTDGMTFTAGPTIYDVAADTPLETELIFVPSGKLLALVRMDGTDEELLGDRGRL